MHIPKRENVIVNRLNKTKVEREVDHEQERIDRLKKEAAKKRAAAVEQVCLCGYGVLSKLTAPQRKAEQELARAREAEKAARSYNSLFSGEEEPQPQKSVREMEDDFM